MIVIDGGYRAETPNLISYLKSVTGKEHPHIDVWFLSHAHDDHCEVFLEVAEHYADVLTFDKLFSIYSVLHVSPGMARM